MVNNPIPLWSVQLLLAAYSAYLFNNSDWDFNSVPDTHLGIFVRLLEHELNIGQLQLVTVCLTGKQPTVFMKAYDGNSRNLTEKIGIIIKCRKISPAFVKKIRPIYSCIYSEQALLPWGYFSH